LKEFEDKVTTAEARAIERERILFDRLTKQATAQAAPLSEFADIVAELDVLACFADIARRFNYTRPAMVDAPVLDVAQGRHPVLDRTLGERFVPNDCVLGQTSKRPNVQTSNEAADDAVPAGAPGAHVNVSTFERFDASSLALITGPNMAGKSTFIRQTALIVLLAHTGSFVPAERATIGAVDRIFTRIGSADELHAGQSTFMVEMTETANILHHATERSLVILDEIGRGTSTLDGLSLAWAIAETIARIGCRALFATHYHELTRLAEYLPGVINCNVAVREWDDQVVFLHRIVPGGTDRSYGVHVARLAGVPRQVIARSRELLAELEAKFAGNSRVPEQAARRKPRDNQLLLFADPAETVIAELRAIDTDALTPLDALQAVARWKKQIE
jgi:DNA mismatch repair protein MutS